MRKIMLAAVLALLFIAPSQAQGIKGLAQKNDVNAPGGIAATVAQGQEADGLLSNLSQKVLDDFKAALALAKAQDAAGRIADPIAAPCLEAVIPVIELIMKDTAASEGDGIVTKVVKARILRLKLQSQDLQIACAPWKQDARTNVVKGATDILGLLFGAMKFGLL